ncbi:MAG: AraC family transcriptional regulator [Ruminococcaceae bacterium]|nr:AraC family transcriptional regulator [Oscillospiraceae bacterium]
MTVSSLTEKGFDALSLPFGEREIDGVYIGDLLSFVMGNCCADNIWITIMSNINVIAVASLTDVSCVLLAEGVTLDNEVLKEAKNKGINVLATKMTAYETAVYLSELLK